MVFRMCWNININREIKHGEYINKKYLQFREHKMIVSHTGRVNMGQVLKIINASLNKWAYIKVWDLWACPTPKPCRQGSVSILAYKILSIGLYSDYLLFAHDTKQLHLSRQIHSCWVFAGTNPMREAMPIRTEP